MQDKQPTLLLTRPKPQSEEFLATCEEIAGRRLPVVISPIMRIELRKQLPDVRKYATIIFTSANGVAAIPDVLRGRQVVTVGEKTADAATRSGAVVRALGENAEQLVARSIEIQGPALHIRGTHARGDIALRLRKAGIEVDEAVVYDQVSQPLNKAALALLQGEGLVIAPVFSPRSAKLLSGMSMTADARVIAMSADVAEAWAGRGEIEVAPSPTAEAMAQSVVKHF
ncbi:MAG: uroporphyrinogen-III synthase [Silicimonas sp.]|nr:uroporphyrinogen-III synthase [Silicimonas sp.]